MTLLSLKKIVPSLLAWPELQGLFQKSSWQKTGVHMNYPRALFAPDGSILPCRHKNKLTSQLESLAVLDTSATTTNVEPRSRTNRTANHCLILDGMAVLHEISSIHGMYQTAGTFPGSLLKLQITHEAISSGAYHF